MVLVAAAAGLVAGLPSLLPHPDECTVIHSPHKFMNSQTPNMSCTAALFSGTKNSDRQTKNCVTA